MTDTAIASAVAVPDEAHTPEPSQRANSLKRRQSDRSEEEEESKRQRISPGKNSPTALRDGETASTLRTKEDNQDVQDKPVDSREARRKSSVAYEKQRSMRLFGALLGSLNQPSDRTSKRRQEIESRRKAELQRQDDERIEDKLRRQEKLAEQRKKVQAKLDEQHMRIRHSNMLNTANFLQTVSEPRIYYRPWDLRPDEEDRIEDQVKEAQAQIDRELDGFDKMHRPVNGMNVDSGIAPVTNEGGDTAQTGGVTEIVPHDGLSNGPDARMADVKDHLPAKSADEEDSKPAEVPDSDPTNSDTDKLSKPEDGTIEVPKNEQAEFPEEQGDHVVEGDEEEVIY